MVRASRGNAAAGTAEWLCLAAAPTFAVMALVTAIFGESQPDLLCAVAPGASPLSGMVRASEKSVAVDISQASFQLEYLRLLCM